MLETDISVKLDHFDGPLALLLHLIQREEMKIQDLDLTKITEQYLDYLQKMHDLNFDVAGEFLYMAASLLFIKSQACVTESEQRKELEELAGKPIGIQSKSDLIKRLEELERFQRLGQRLWELPKQGHEIFIKPKVNKKSIINSVLTPLDLQELTMAMVDYFRREQRKYTVVRRDRLSIKEKLIQLTSMLKKGSKAEFTKLCDKEKGMDDVVITFISLLELSRLKKVSIFQPDDRGEIYVDVMDDLTKFDVETATGFEEEGAEQKATDIPIAPAPETLQ